MPLSFFAMALLQAAPAVPAVPAGGYWQQEVRYEIHAALDEARGLLAGTERVWYRNRSPDTLTTISFHLHLNAFRPGSRWADADSLERHRRFNDLRDPDYGFNRVGDIRIDGVAVTPAWPFAPDSTIVRLALPRPLPPGDSMVVAMTWEGRPSTVARRQGRRGRRFDFAHSYPKVVVYDRHGWNENPLYPGGEFYGEFATYLVDLDLPADQVLGATGVPICGDPGWAGANRNPAHPPDYQRTWYPRAPAYRAAGGDCLPVAGPGGKDGVEAAVPPLAAGRKRVVWYAEDVHHWAASLNPEYRYEGSAFGPVAIHVLYQPGDEATWGGGIATQRTALALGWLDGVFGPFAWPQITAVHRIEGGGTEFPMMMHNGSASQGLIVHELGHNYTMGILANNEWREGWLDEGFTSFQTTLFTEARRPGTDGFLGDEAFITGLDLEGRSEPASLVSQDYRDFTSYQLGIYTRGELFFHQLRALVGDAALQRILRTFYDRWKLRHVDEAAFREVAEAVSGMDLGGFFAQALHGTVLTDYAIGRVKLLPVPGRAAPPAAGREREGAPDPGPGWEARVEVVRRAEGRFPVEVWVIGEGDTAMVRAAGQAEREWVTVTTRTRPRVVLLDPRLRARDWNMLNNVWRRGWLFPVRSPKREHYLDTWFRERTARDHRTLGWMPTAWYNDAGGLTVGLRRRGNYFGRFDRSLVLSSFSTGEGVPRGKPRVRDRDVLFRYQNPTWLRGPGLSETFEAYNVEGRFGARLAVERTRSDHLGWGPERTVAVSLTWLQPDDFRYLDRGQYENAGTVELGLRGGVRDERGGWQLRGSASAAGGLAYHRGGLAAAGRSDVAPFYGRFEVEGLARRDLGAHWRVGLRVYGGSAPGRGLAVKQRQIYLSGADPLARFGNPFLRSVGALAVRPGVYYHASGGGDLRGYDPRLSAEGLVAGTLELERKLFRRPRAGLFREVVVAAFGDVGQSAGDGGAAPWTIAPRLLADAGVGVRAEHRLGETAFVTRFDLPLLVSRPSLAQDTGPGRRVSGFRWTVSVGPAWLE